MEFLDTTLELFSENAHWEGKMEPPSPSQVTLDQSTEDPWLNEDYFATNELTIDELFKFDLPPEKKCVAEQLLTELSQDIKDEQWLNEKMVIPSLDEYPPPPLEPVAVKKQDTQELLQEFESVYDAVELTHLTPPQTPPQTSPQRLTVGEAGQCIDQTFIYQEPVLYGALSTPATFYALTQQEQPQSGSKSENAFHFTLSSFAAAGQEQQVVVDGGDLVEIVQSPMPEDIDHEMELVDELVRSRAQDLPDWTDDDDSSEFMSTPSSLSPRSEASFSGSSYSHDDEWLPEKDVKVSKVGGGILGGGGVRKRTRPYARGSEDKKSRKKEQNKNAATRYRKKKKQEIEVVLEEEKVLQQEHEKLKSVATDLKREIKYLKGLMREVYKAKGLLD